MTEEHKAQTTERTMSWPYSFFERLTLAMVLLVMLAMQILFLLHIQAEHSAFSQSQMDAFQLASLFLPWMILAAAFWEPLWDGLYRAWAFIKDFRGVSNAE